MARPAAVLPRDDWQVATTADAPASSINLDLQAFKTQLDNPRPTSFFNEVNTRSRIRVMSPKSASSFDPQLLHRNVTVTIKG